MTIYEIIIAIISLCSLVFSIYSNFSVKTIKKKNKYYDGLFKKQLFIVIPDLYRRYVSGKNPNLDVEHEFEEAIQKFRNDILVMDFVNSKFYIDIDDKLVAIDDTVVRISNRTSEYESLKIKLHDQIKTLYATINKFFD